VSFNKQIRTRYSKIVIVDKPVANKKTRKVFTSSSGLFEKSLRMGEDDESISPLKG
jgi:hypothetical protein